MAYSRYEDPRLIAAQNANVKAIQPFVKGFSGAGEAVLSAREGIKGMAAPFIETRAKNVDALAGHPERNARLQGVAGKLKQDIGSGNFPKPQGFNPITRPSYAGKGVVTTEGPQVGNSARNGLLRPDVEKPRGMAIQQADGGKGSMTVRPGDENIPSTQRTPGFGPNDNNASGHGRTAARSGLNVQWDANTPVDERARFTESALREAARPRQQVGGPPAAQSIVQQTYQPIASDGSFGGQIDQALQGRTDGAYAKMNDAVAKNGIAMRGQDIDTRGQDLAADASNRQDLLHAQQNEEAAATGEVAREGQTIDNQGKQLGLDQTQALNDLFSQYNDPNVPAEKKQAIADEIRLRQGKTDKKQRPITMTRATADGMGSETILVDPETYEEIQVQKAPQALAPPPKDTKGLPVGHMAVSASGVPIIWDGKGWKLA